MAIVTAGLGPQPALLEESRALDDQKVYEQQCELPQDDMSLRQEMCMS